MTVSLFFIRHGETDWNRERRIQGMYGNPPLNERGIQQAQRTSAFLSQYPFNAFYCSPLIRALETAKIIADPHTLTPVSNFYLSEMNYGEWEGKKREEITGSFPHEIKTEEESHFSCPGGESYYQAYHRFFQTVQKIVQQHPHQQIAVITHGSVLLLFLSKILGTYKNAGISIDNCSIHRVLWNESGTFRLITLNQIHHLDPV
ncbi:MAG: histidine phosphatase family protein [Planctomycetota bacterium]